VTEQHGGVASVANAPDGGAVFTLTLPAAPPEYEDEHDQDLGGPAPSHRLNVS
jgi:K+-sensing histidine kinase KdpD